MKLRLKKRLNLLLLFLSFWPFCAVLAEQNQNAPSPESEIETKNARIFIAPEFTTLSLNGTRFYSAGLGSTLFYSLSSDWGLGLGLRQGFATSSLAALFTEIDVQAKWALTGSLRLQKETLRIEGSSVSVSADKNVGGLRAQLFIHQYFFNVGSTVFPVPGAGVGMAYEFSSEKQSNYTFGLRFDRASNGVGLTFYPLQVFFGLGLWL